SATAKAAWLDEAGQQNFSRASWEAVGGRVALHKGRILITTTPYAITGWLKDVVFDPWRRLRQRGLPHPEIEVVQFRSTLNPAFPEDEFERLRRELPPHRFALFYEGDLDTKPPGLIYPCFDSNIHIVPRFRIDPTWERFLGLDFGGVNTVGVFLARQPGTDRCYLYREYGANGSAAGRTAADHTEELLRGEPRIPDACVGGAKSQH